MDRRNPRRAYDANGREFTPLTIGGMRAMGTRHVTASCHAVNCFHTAEINAELFPADLPVPDVALRLKCLACGSRQINVRPNWTEHRPHGAGHTHTPKT